jgi:adenylate kinase family enzyme
MSKYRKILVTGNAGSGKTTLSKILSDKRKIPSYGLDNVVWMEGWKKTPAGEKKQKIEKIIENECWVVDGVSHQVFDAADTIVFLDLPLHRCLLNIVLRFAKNGIGTRDSLPEKCPEWIGVWKAIKISFVYHRNTRPEILEKIRNSKSKKIIRLDTVAQIDAFGRIPIGH